MCRRIFFLSLLVCFLAWPGIFQASEGQGSGYDPGKAYAPELLQEDFDLLRVFDSPVDVADAVEQWYTRQEVKGRKALGD